MAERQLPKLNVAGSIPVSRSKIRQTPPENVLAHLNYPLDASSTPCAPPPHQSLRRRYEEIDLGQSQFGHQ